MALTGRFNFRRTLTGRVVLQVEDERRAAWPRSGVRRRWRDAKVIDLANPMLRALIDLRLKPYFPPQGSQAQQDAAAALAEADRVLTSNAGRMALKGSEVEPQITKH